MVTISGRAPDASAAARMINADGACSTKLAWARIAHARAATPPSPALIPLRTRFAMTLPVSAAPRKPRIAANAAAGEIMGVIGILLAGMEANRQWAIGCQKQST